MVDLAAGKAAAQIPREQIKGDHFSKWSPAIGMIYVLTGTASLFRQSNIGVER